MPPKGPRWYYLGPWILFEGEEGPYHAPPEHTVGLVDLRGLEGGVGFFATDEPLYDSSYELLGTSLDDEIDGSVWRSLTGIPVPDGNRSILDTLWLALTEFADPEGFAFAKPLMPTHKGYLELHLGGHSLVRKRRFLGTDDPAWDRIQAVLQADYRNIRTTALRLGRENPDLHRKVLQAWKQKFRVHDESAFIPRGLPVERGVRPTTVIRDDFNRADGVLHGQEATYEGVGQGWYWFGDRGTEVIVSNQLNCVGKAVPEFYLSSSDHYCQAFDSGTNGSRQQEVRVRYADQNYYTFIHDWQIHVRGFWKIVSGSATQMNVINGAPNSLVRLEADGSNFTWTVGASITGTITDTSITDQLQVAISGFTTSSNRRRDNFEAGDLLAEPAFRPEWAEGVNKYVGFN